MSNYYRISVTALVLLVLAGSSIIITSCWTILPSATPTTVPTATLTRTATPTKGATATRTSTPTSPNPPTSTPTQAAAPVITTRLGWAPVDTPKSVLLFNEGGLWETIYVVANGSNELLAIDPKEKESDGSLRIIKRIPVGRSPFGLAQASAPDGQPLLAVGNARDNSLTIIKALPNKVIETVRLPGSPARLAGSGFWFLVTIHDQGTLYSRSTKTGDEVHSTDVNTGPFDIAVNRKTGWIYTTSHDGRQITAVEKPELITADRLWWWLEDQIPYSIATDPISGNIFVSVAADQNPDHPDRVLVIYPDYPTLRVERTDPSCDSGPGGEIVPDEIGGYFIACTSSNEVWHIGTSGQVLDKIQTGKGPFGLDYSAKSRRIIVGSKISNMVEVFSVK